MSLIHYKFKAAKGYDSVTFDGLALSLFELKRDILLAKKLKGTDFDIIVSNAQNNEDYTDDTQKIPKNTSVFVRRVPSKPGGSNAQHYLNEVTPADANAKRIGDQGATGYSFAGLNSFNQNEEYVPLSLDGVLPGRNEDDQVQALISQSSMQFQAQSYPGQAYPSNNQQNNGYNNGYNNRPTGKPHPSYTCHRCGLKGHFVQNCQSQKDKRSFSPPKIKRTTGIPRAFLEKVDDVPEGRSAMITSDGSLVVSRPNNAAWERSRNNARGSAFAADELRETVPAPEKYKCNICEKLLNNAVSVPCCSTLFCQDCITSALVDTERDLQFICPKCDQREVVPNDLRAENSIRDEVEDFLKQIASGNVPSLEEPIDNLDDLFDGPAENNNPETGGNDQLTSYQRSDNNFNRSRHYVDRRHNNSNTNYQNRRNDNRNNNRANNNYNNNNWNNNNSRESNNDWNNNHTRDSYNNDNNNEPEPAQDGLYDDDLGLEDQLPNEDSKRSDFKEDELLEKELETLPPLRWTSDSGITGHITIPPVEKLNGKSPFEVKGGDARRFHELLRNNRSDRSNNDHYETDNRVGNHSNWNSNTRDNRHNRTSSRSRSPTRRARSRSPLGNDDRDSRNNRDTRDGRSHRNNDRHGHNNNRNDLDLQSNRNDRDSQSNRGDRDNRTSSRNDRDSRNNRDDRYSNMNKDRKYSNKSTNSNRSRSRSRSPVRSNRRVSVDRSSNRNRPIENRRNDSNQRTNSYRDSSPRNHRNSESRREDNGREDRPYSNSRDNRDLDTNDDFGSRDKEMDTQISKKVDILKMTTDSRDRSARPRDTNRARNESGNRANSPPNRGTERNEGRSSTGGRNNETRISDLITSQNTSEQVKSRPISINDRIGRPKNEISKANGDSRASQSRSSKNDKSNESEKRPSILDRIGPINNDNDNNNEKRSKRNHHRNNRR